MSFLHQITFGTPGRPPPKTRPLTAFDFIRGVFVQFGGFSTAGGFAVLNDTAEYDPKTNIWTERQPITPPSARSWLQGSFDSDNGKIFAFGGTTQAVILGELIAYDGSIPRWDVIAASGAPADRGLAGLSYDSVRKRHVLFGGLDPDFSTVLGDLHELDATVGSEAWSLPSVEVGGDYLSSPPVARSGVQQVYDASRNLTVIVGGLDQSVAPLVETLLWDGTGFRLQGGPLHPPAEQLSGAAIAYIPALKKVLLFGGSSLAGSNRLWALDENGWEEIFFGVGAAIPSPRDNLGCGGGDSRRLYVFAGADAVDTFNDLWTTEGTSWEECRTGFSVTPIDIYEISNGLRIQGSAPFSTTMVRVIDEVGIKVTKILSVDAITSIPVGTVIRYTLEIDGIEYYFTGGVWLVSDGSGADGVTTELEVIQPNVSTLPIDSVNGSLVRLFTWIRTDDSDFTPELDEFQMVVDCVDLVATDPRLCVVTGTVRDSNGTVEGAAIRVRPSAPDQFTGDQLVLGVNDRTFSDINGFFTLSLFETETDSKTVDFEVSYTGADGVVSKSFAGVTIPDLDSAEFSEITQ